jgi:hypothetical protein
MVLVEFWLAGSGWAVVYSEEGAAIEKGGDISHPGPFWLSKRA